MASPPEPKKTAEATTEATAEASDGDPMDEEAKIDIKEAEEAEASVDSPPGGDESSKDNGDGNGKEGDGEDSKAASAAGANGVENKNAEEKDAGGEGTSNGRDRDRSTGRKRKEEEAAVTELDVYRRDMSWLRSAHGMVAEVKGKTSDAYVPSSKSLWLALGSVASLFLSLLCLAVKS